jgi:phytoene dehydrogenase-like protein
MRLGLIGPAENRDDLLERAVRFLYRDLGVHRAIYLGLDPALDRVVHDMAAKLVNDEPGEAAVWQRAANRCADASPDQIDEFLQAERERLALVVFASLPGGETRLVELLNGKVAVMIHDKALLDEDDIASATYLVFGKSDEPLVKPIGSRWFLSPGPLATFGIMLLEDADGRVELSLYDNLGHEVRRERLLSAPSNRVSITGQ